MHFATVQQTMKEQFAILILTQETQLSSGYYNITTLRMHNFQDRLYYNISRTFTYFTCMCI